jgi:Regulator of chromosome condensation (RCC1) repeat
MRTTRTMAAGIAKSDTPVRALHARGRWPRAGVATLLLAASLVFSSCKREPPRAVARYPLVPSPHLSVCAGKLDVCVPWRPNLTFSEVELGDLSLASGEIVGLTATGDIVHATNGREVRWANVGPLVQFVRGGGWQRSQSDTPSMRRNPATGSFVRGEGNCAIDAKNILRCEYNQWPSRYVALAGGWIQVCALRVDRELECREPWSMHAEQVPVGPWKQVAMAAFQACALRPDGELVCWDVGRRSLHQPLKLVATPTTRFAEVSVGDRHVCGLELSGAVSCWGNDEFGQTRAPTGRFVHVAAFGNRSCARDSEGDVRCWGWTTAAP